MKEFLYKNVIFYCGQNANENWDLLDKSNNENKEYIWFHLNSFASPYVIMFSTINELKNQYSEDEVLEILTHGAEICKENSKYKFLNDLKIVYTSLKKIKKGNKVGEVIISGKKNIIKL
jgi:hypothetical protein